MRFPSVMVHWLEYDMEDDDDNLHGLVRQMGLAGRVDQFR